MANIKETAQAYEPPKTLNIADLDKVPMNLELKDGSGLRKDGTEFRYKYIEIEGKEYRVPGSVLGQIKAILKRLPNVKEITVTKEGEGKTGTRYQVIPLGA